MSIRIIDSSIRCSRRRRRCARNSASSRVSKITSHRPTSGAVRAASRRLSDSCRRFLFPCPGTGPESLIGAGAARQLNRAHVRFSSTPRGARLARRLAGERLNLWGTPYGSNAHDALTLTAAELSTNAAVRHSHVSGRGFRLRLSAEGTANPHRGHRHSWSPRSPAAGAGTPARTGRERRCWEVLEVSPITGAAPLAEPDFRLQTVVRQHATRRCPSALGDPTVGDVTLHSEICACDDPMHDHGWGWDTGAAAEAFAAGGPGGPGGPVESAAEANICSGVG